MGYVCAVVVAALAATVAGGPATAASCPSNLAGGLTSTGSASQLITVEAPGYASSTRVAEARGAGPAAAGSPPAAPGACGSGATGSPTTTSRATARRRRAPTGSGRVIYGIAPDPGVRYPYHRLSAATGGTRIRARPATTPSSMSACGTTPPFAAGGDGLWLARARTGTSPDRYNTRPVVPGRGSGDLPARRLGPPDARLHHPRGSRG